MIVTYVDLQDETSPDDVRTYSCVAELTALWRELRKREPFTCQLIGDNGAELTIGTAPHLNAVQFGTSDGLPPYLMALTNCQNCRSLPAEFEFLCGDTATPFPRRYLLSTREFEQVISDFVTHGIASPSFAWEEV